MAYFFYGILSISVILIIIYNLRIRPVIIIRFNGKIIFYRVSIKIFYFKINLVRKKFTIENLLSLFISTNKSDDNSKIESSDLPEKLYKTEFKNESPVMSVLKLFFLKSNTYEIINLNFKYGVEDPAKNALIYGFLTIILNIAGVLVLNIFRSQEFLIRLTPKFGKLMVNISIKCILKIKIGEIIKNKLRR